ncbi:MAG TPA: VWA domain-containing protein [Candidatus Competibacter sp.]|uniref:von Willebrand factor type A n=1 Tax=Candidatus Competibacter denitrificans Run_A_D11 TaxID=1400863 RepID=W6MBK0_9GAMM|nr:VWA domain-containing protein [Candidatus Competibacter denitrificans]CDI04349.1 putative von Willebrand factor type A [Candidatus Competibacter denitrificans Run_A_D11]HRC71963.1 VWA domain-containing protein [Candidatus Competibacter sp.]
MKSSLVGALPLIAQMLGRKRGLRVVIEGQRAFTDFQTITIPALPPDDVLAGVYAHGFIDHESGHLRYTDPAILKPAGLLGLLLNLLEDIRIEQALGRAYPGSRQNLAALMTALEAQQSVVPAADAPPVQQLVMGLLALLRWRVLGQSALQSAAALLEARLMALLSEPLWRTVWTLAFAVRTAESTAEVLALAQAMVQALTDALAAPQHALPPGLGHEAPVSGPDAMPATDAGAGSDTTPSGNAESGPDAMPTVDASASPTADRISPDRAVLQALLETTENVSAADIGARVAALLEAKAAQTDGLGVTVAGVDPPRPPRPNPALCRAARVATRALSRRLATLLEAHTHGSTARSRRGRRLDHAHLDRLTVGDSRLFQQHVRGETVDTAVGLLLDRSGSMQTDLALASQAVLALALALDGIAGVRCQALAFPGQGDTVIPLKDWAERAQAVAGRFALSAHGGTPLAPALWRLAFEMIQRPAARRLVIVITDGEPDHCASVLDILTRCRASGIAVLGIGVGLTLEAVQRVFGPAHAIAIQQVEALAPRLFGLLEQHLFGARA